jgi:hypothetical protein
MVDNRRAITDCGLRIADSMISFASLRSLGVFAFSCVPFTNMKIIFPLFIIAAAFLQSADRWEVCRGPKTLLKATEDEPPHTILLSGTDTSAIIINFQEAPSNIQWKRDFILRASNDSILQQFSFNYSAGKFRLPFNKLSDFISAHDSVTLTTEQHPAKDDVMARSKIVVIGVFKRK